MSNHPKLIPPGKPAASSSPERKNSGAPYLVLAIVVLAGFGFWRWKTQTRSAGVPSLPATVEEAVATNTMTAEASEETLTTSMPPVKAITADPDYLRLTGRWQRPDGGYVIDIKGVAEDGTLDAGYFNPRPIHVAKAQASRDGELTKVFVELRDVNYPGSTYTLQYNPQNDQLSGIYFQAVQQQNFEVVFVRMP